MVNAAPPSPLTAESATVLAPAGAVGTVDALWRELSGPLRGFIRSRTATDADADDLLQEVFVRIHRQLGELREPAKLQGWVYRIARNVVIDHYRGRRPEVPLENEPPAADPTGRDAVDLTPALRRFLAELPASYREPLVRHEFQGEGLAEIAASLGLTLTAMKSRVRRARLQLREMLDRCCRFEFDRRGHVIEAIPRGPCECGEGETARSAEQVATKGRKTRKGSEEYGV